MNGPKELIPDVIFQKCGRDENNISISLDNPRIFQTKISTVKINFCLYISSPQSVLINKKISEKVKSMKLYELSIF